MLALSICAIPADAQAVPRSPGLPYAPRGVPDRIVLTPGAKSSSEMAVAFRTDTLQAAAQAQLAEAVDGPTLEERALLVGGNTRRLDSANGKANYHSVRFSALKPDTVYAYRVKGSAGWSEWFQFRTASARARPFRMLYLGDLQNSILEHGARVLRAAFSSKGGIQLVLHAGDLTAQRDDLDHDDEWGEWNAAGAYNLSSIPQLPAAGNHEYIPTTGSNGPEVYTLGPYWPLQFALPANGAEPVRSTTYFVDYQGVRFIVLDGTAAVEGNALDGQTRWLEKVLKASNARWKVVLMHQPLFTCARSQDTPRLKESWKPLFERYRVDLVLQGHDHCYSRLTSEAGKQASRRDRAARRPLGPVYIVSVSGAKMYRLNNRATRQPDKVAEATQLFQLIDIDGLRIRFRSYTATGRLYDGFDLLKDRHGRNRMTELQQALVPVRTCASERGPDGGPCVAEPRD